MLFFLSLSSKIVLNDTRKFSAEAYHPPPPPRTGHYQSCQVSRFTRESPGFRADLQVSRLVLKISRMVLYAWISATPPPPPSLLGKQSKSDNIRFTVGQYWLIIKKNGTNSVNFVRNCVNFAENFVISGKFV